MDREQFLPLGEFELDERCDDLDAGVADQQHVERAERRDDLFGPCADRGLVGDVHRNADGALAGRIDLARGGFGGREIEIGDRDFRALAGVDDRDHLADAACGAGDQGHLVFETHFVFSRRIGPDPKAQAR